MGDSNKKSSKKTFYYFNLICLKTVAKSTQKEKEYPMNSLKKTVLILLCSASVTMVHAQYRSSGEDVLFHLGLNAVGDAGVYLAPFTKSNARNFSNPLILGVEYHYSRKSSVKASISFNKYIAGKDIDGHILLTGQEANYTAIDVDHKFKLNNLSAVDDLKPYIFGGLGYTNISSYSTSATRTIPEIGRLTFNAGFGADYWISNSFGFNINFSGKFGMRSGEYQELITNQSQLSFGVFSPLNFRTSSWR